MSATIAGAAAAGQHVPQVAPLPNEYLKVAAQPVQGPWPPHQRARPDPDEDSLPVAVPDPQARPARRGADDGPRDDYRPAP